MIPRLPSSRRFARLFSLSLLALVAARPAGAIQIKGESAEAHHRFVSGFWTSSPVPNESSAFLGAGADLSPMGWENIPMHGGRPRHATLIAPQFTVGVAHYAFPPGRTLLFRSRTGEIVSGVVEGANTAFDDTSVTRLTRPFLAGEAVSVVRVLDVRDVSVLGGMPTRPTGGSSSAGTKMADSAVYDVVQGMIFRQYGNYYPSPAYSFDFNESGDSGSPVFIPYKGEFTLLGPVATGGGAGQLLVPNAGHSPSTTAAVNALMAPFGYALRFAIYDVPEEPSRTSPAWTATAIDADWGAEANWSSNSVPAGLPVVLPRETAANGVAVAVPREARGVLFRGAGPDPQRITGAGVFSLGTSGLRNESPGAAPVVSCPVKLVGSQNWEAAAGGIVVSGPVDTNGFLLALHCGHEVSISGPISGSGLIAASGPGVLSLSGENTYSGYTYIHGGRLRLESDGAASPSSIVVFAAESDAELDLGGHSVSVGGIRSKYGATGVVRLGGGTLTTGLNPMPITYDGVFVGPGEVIKAGGSNWTLRGDNRAFAGRLEVRAGILTLGGPEALGGGLNIVTDGGRIETVASQDLRGEVTFAATHNGSGSFTAGLGAQFFSSRGSGTVTRFRDRVTLERRGTGTGPLRMSMFGNGGGGQRIVLAAGVRTAGATTGPMRLSLSTATDASGVIEVHGAIEDGEGPSLELNVLGSGALRLLSPGGSAYRGGTLVNAGSTLVLTPSVASATGSGTVSVLAGGTLTGMGRIGGRLSLASDSTLRLAPEQPGAAPLQVGALTVAAGARLVVTEIGGSVRVGRHVLVSGAAPVQGEPPAVLLPDGFLGSTALEGGDLVLNLSGVPYPHWAAGHGLEGADAGHLADPDGDGVSNALEFAFGSRPESAASVPVLEVKREGARLALVFTRATDTARVRVEASGDFADWQDVPFVPVPAGETQTVEDVVDLATAPGGRRFMRLVVDVD